MHRDWTTLESSDEDSSRHNDSEEEEISVAPQQKQPVKQESKIADATKPPPEPNTSSPQKQEATKPPPKQKKEYDFPTDEQLVKMLEASPGPWMLKIVFSFEYDEDALKEMFPKIKKIVNCRPGTFEVHFDHIQDAKDFLVEKKMKKYRFRIKNPEKDAKFARKDNRENRGEGRGEGRGQGRGQGRGDHEKKPPQPRPPAVATRREHPQQQKQHMPKKQLLFREQNKITFNHEFPVDKVNAEDIVREINQREMFKGFSGIVFVSGEEKDDQLYSQVKKLAEEVSKQLGRSIQQGKFACYQCVKIMELLPADKKVTKPQEPSGTQQPPAEDFSYVKKSKESKTTEQKKEEKQPNIIRHNTIFFKEDLIDKQRLFRELRQSKLLEEFGYLRIKAFQENIKGARQLARLIEAEFNCDQTSTYFENPTVAIVLRRKNQEYIQTNDNTIKITDKLIVEDAVNEIKQKWGQINQGFSGVSIEYGSDNGSKQKVEELAKALQREGFKELHRREKGQATKLTFGRDDKKQETQAPQAKVAVEPPKPNRQEKTEKAVSKPHPQKPNANDLIKLPDSNLVQITKKIDERQLLEEFDRKKEKLFEMFNTFRLRTEVEQLFKHTSALGEMISQRFDLIMKESDSKTETGKRMDIMLRKKKQEKEKEKTAPTGKKKPDTTKINEYLDSN